MEEEILKRMLDMAQKSGGLALDLADEMRPSLKKDRSVLTAADTAVSEWVRAALQDLLKTGEHILLDEEDAANTGYFSPERLAAQPFVWVVDPIDGTRNFSNRMPTFGISLGVLKNLEPWLGVVYFPSFRELFYADGQEAFFVENAFGPNERSKLITPLDQKISNQSVFLGDDAFFRKYEWDFSLCPVSLLSCAVINLCWPAVGRGCGAVFNANAWDFIGSWPIFRAAGLDLRSLSTAEELTCLDTRLFKGQDGVFWRLKDDYLLSSRRNYPVLKKHMRPRK